MSPIVSRAVIRFSSNAIAMGNKPSNNDHRMEIVKSFLDEKGFHYNVQNGSIFMFVECSFGSFKVEIHLHTGTGLIFIYSSFPTKIRLEYFQRAAEYMARINYSLKTGNFEIDPRDGEIRFKTTMPTKGLSNTAITKTLVIYFGRNVFTLQKQFQALTKICSVYNISVKEILGLENEAKGIPNTPVAPARSDISPTGPSRNKPPNEALQIFLDAIAGLRLGTNGSPPKLDSDEKVEGIKKIVLPSSSGTKNSTENIISPNIPQKHGNYDIAYNDIVFEEKIGEGGFAEVWKGKWMGSAVAIKKLKGAINNDLIEDLYREVGIMMCLHHPHTLLLLGICERPPCMVTELMSFNLANLISERFSIITIEIRQKILAGIASGMFYLHRQNPAIIHGDLKPLNVLLDDNFNVRIADYGLSKYKIAHASSSAVRMQAGITMMVPVVGFTPHYASPEMLETGQMSTRSDVYAFAIIMWELLTGKTPYFGRSPAQAILFAVVKDNLRPEIPSNTPMKYKELMCACWAPKLTERPTFEEIVAKLDDLN